jgi:hypothetical protein
MRGSSRPHEYEVGAWLLEMEVAGVLEARARSRTPFPEPIGKTNGLLHPSSSEDPLVQVECGTDHQEVPELPARRHLLTGEVSEARAIRDGGKFTRGDVVGEHADSFDRRGPQDASVRAFRSATVVDSVTD